MNHSQRNYLDSIANLDLLRQQRTGMPEVIYAESKTSTQTITIAERILQHNHRVLVSRANNETVAALVTQFNEHLIIRGTADRIITIATPNSRIPDLGGHVGIIAAGTSDLPAADEAAAICTELGCAVHRVTDVGVAGLHRLFEPLRQLIEIPVDVIIVAAGMDGALPSVVTGLVDVPVIGLPTAVGYGYGGQGLAAMGTMLQSCAPGISVVNIDNGIGAGAVAARIARKMHDARIRGTK
jgi:pyridinium-3,5-biscarboxylic acid mononucleotide synthase